MNILVVNYEYPPLGGGGGVACEQIAAELAAMGHTVDVLTSLGPGLPVKEVRNGVNITRVAVWGRRRKATASMISMLSFVPLGIRAGRKLLSSRNYDVVHVHFAVPSGPVGVRLGRAAGCPVVLSIHGGDLYDPTKFASPHRHPPVRLVVRRVLNAADRVLAQSTNTMANARKYYRFSGRVDVVPLGIPPRATTPARREDFGLGDDDMVLLTVGRLVRRKGLEYLLDAVAGLERRGLRLVIVGDGPQRASLEAQADRLGLKENVSFTGFVGEEQKFQLFDLADVFVMASIHEGFGIIFLEAMAAGLPIVATNVGGQVDFLTHERNALLVAPEDSETLRAAISRLLSDVGLRREMGAKNRLDVEKFRIRRIAERHEAIFKEVIAAGREARAQQEPE